ncbi:hypothetical protein EV401DRAFT_234578 [Pisolithus croceorrhizus]|nr:hypothetical protein EV401DRAFT_234578 [Pisolithus croceorrhizus]
MFYLSDKTKLAVSSYGMSPPSRPATMTVRYFGVQTKFTLPPIAPFAILSQFARAEEFPLKVPPQLPANRREALMAGNSVRSLPRRTSNTSMLISQSHDPDWSRSLPGVLSTAPKLLCPWHLVGLLARVFHDALLGFLQIYVVVRRGTINLPFLMVGFHSTSASASTIAILRQRLYPWRKGKSAFFNAFLPQGCHWYEVKDGLELVGKNNSFRTKYEPFRRQQDSPQCGDAQDSSQGGEIRDVIIVGETEEPYASAWNGYKYIGRVRPSDGLVILVRGPHDVHTDLPGRALFRGYVLSSCNFVGRWRSISTGEQPAEWECIFSMSKAASTP